MAEIEKYIPRRINKDVAPDALYPNGTDRMFLPGEMTDALNCRYKTGSSSFGKNKSIPGTISKLYALPSGRNKQIGRFENHSENTVIYCIWNESNDHRVVEYSLDQDSFQTLLSGPSLPFTENDVFHSGGIVANERLVIANGVSYILDIDIKKARLGGYVAPYSKYQLSLATRPPHNPPTIAIVTDNSLLLNNVAKTTWQFAYQFVYDGNKISTFSPLSKLAWIRPFFSPDDNTDNAIDVTVSFPVELSGIVVRINVAYREGNTGNYFIFETIDNPQSDSYTVRFTNTGKSIAISTEDQLRLYDYIPEAPKTIDITENRVFSPINNIGFDVDDSTFDLQLSLTEERAQVTGDGAYSGEKYNNRRYLKDGGIYSAGVIFKDDYGRTSFVKKTKTIQVPYKENFSALNRSVLNWQLTGTPPAGFSSYQIVLTRNKFQLIYFKTPVVLHFYVSDIGTNEEDGTQNETHYWWRGKKFIKRDKITEIREDTPEFKYCYLQLPFNVPFIPDQNCIIRFYDPVEGAGFFKEIIGVIGDLLVVDMRIDPNTGDRPKTFYRVEIFKQNDSVEDSFFEVGPVMDIQNDDFTVVNGQLDGDTYVVRLDRSKGYKFDPITVEGAGAAVGNPNYIEQYFSIRDAEGASIYESPSGIFAGNIITLAKNITSQGLRSPLGISTPTNTGEQQGVDTVLVTFDYNKISSDYGRPHIVFNEGKRRDLSSTIAISNPYVQNSFINGLNSYLAENTYDLSIERGPIRAMVNVGGVELAIHERFTSTLYIGEGFMRQNNDFILAKTQDIVGDDRELAESYGTINPESVLRVQNLAFWWDGLRGAVVQYSQAGLYPISNYGMYDYFFAKSRQYYPYRNQIKVITGFDYENKELIITFPEVKNQSGSVIIQAETWIFALGNREWVSRFSFVPEMYASMNTQLISFKQGVLWLHNRNTVFNNFYGIQYVRSSRFWFNARLGKNKRLLNIHIRGSLCQDPTSDFIVVRIKTPDGQESYIPAYEFEKDEGIWVAPVLKDINSPVEEGQLALRSGDDIVGNIIEIEVFNDSVTEAPVSEVNIVYKTEEFSI